MKIVEYAIRIKDMGVTAALQKVGAAVTAQNRAISGYAKNAQTMAKCYSMSYEELQQKIRETENLIRNSVLKKEVREARQELSRLQAQARKHPGNINSGGDLSPSGKKGGGGMGRMVLAGAALYGITMAISGIKKYSEEASKLYEIQMLGERKLEVIMRQRMNATGAEIKGVKELASKEQAKGVIGDEVQLSGAQQLSTFLTKSESIKTLLPAMNNLLAQQNGLNSTDKDAVNIGNLMGKAMQGQIGALTRVGITFSEAEGKVLKYGNEQERSAMLAKVITQNVGDMNARLAETPEGKLKQYANAAGDVQEKYGELINKISLAMLPLKQLWLDVQVAMLPIIESILPEVVNWISSSVEFVKSLKPYIMEMLQPILGFWEQLKGSASGLMDYVKIIGDVWQESIYPAVKKVAEGVFHVLGGLIDWISKSDLLKAIFAGIMGFIGGIYEIISWVVDGIVWLWDNVVRPILDAIDSVVRWLSGSNNITVKATKQKADNKNATQDLTKAIANNTVAQNQALVQENGAAGAANASAISGGGLRSVTFNISKFFDTLTVHAGSVNESTAEIESKILECFARIVNNGAITAMR